MIELQRNGILVFASAGNQALNTRHDLDPSVILIPQNLPNVVSVGGTGPKSYDPTLSDLSVYDPTPGDPNEMEFNLDLVANCDMGGLFPGFEIVGSNYGNKVDIVAPMGNYVDLASFPDDPNLIFGTSLRTSGLGLRLHSAGAGTSHSSPIAAGVAALAIEAYMHANAYEEDGEMVYPKPSPQQVTHILRESADQEVGVPSEDLYVWNSDLQRFEMHAENCSFYTDLSPYVAGCVEPAELADRPQSKRYGAGRVNVVNAIEFAQDM